MHKGEQRLATQLKHQVFRPQLFSQDTAFITKYYFKFYANTEILPSETINSERALRNSSFNLYREADGLVSACS